MRGIISILSFGLLFAGQAAYGCDLAPDYLPKEFGSDRIVLGNIVERAETIVTGKFTNNGDVKGIGFRASKFFKPDSKVFLGDKLAISFPDVNQHYFIPGANTDAFQSVDEILDFVRILKTLGAVFNSQYGVGGPAAGIGHGTDCERSVVIFSGQEYFVFLDSEGSVISRFAIGPKYISSMQSTLKSIQEVLEEINQ